MLYTSNITTDNTATTKQTEINPIHTILGHIIIANTTKTKSEHLNTIFVIIQNKLYMYSTLRDQSTLATFCVLMYWAASFPVVMAACSQAWHNYYDNVSLILYREVRIKQRDTEKATWAWLITVVLSVCQ